MSRIRSMSRSKKLTLIGSLGLLIAALSAVSVLAVVPPSTFGYVTLCHEAGTQAQTTLILRPDGAAQHIAHGDPQVRCADPIPPSAFDPSVDLSNGYHVAEINDGLYWVTEGSYQMMFLVYKDGVIAVDAPPSIGQNILKAINDVTDKPITHVVYSHSHADHIGAAGIYPEDAIVIAHEETAAQLKEALSPDREYPYGAFVGGGPVPLPDKTFKKHFTLRRGRQALELSYKGPNHEPGNIFVYAPKQKTLMLVDVIFPAWAPFPDLALAEDIPGYFEAYEQVLAYDFDTFVGGHLTRLGTPKDIELAQAYLLDVRANAATALGQVDFFAIAQQTGFENQWLLFTTYLDTVAETCAEMTVPEWSGRLAAADVVTYDHCWTVMESLRIE
jgi:glyoxylase-like metal-dependent hydrolase (beta-lactamase superfamily II)